MTAERGDAQILDEVMEALRRDPQVGPAEVGVEVDDGVVTLTGTVDCFEKKLAAIELVHRAARIPDVVNNIQIHVTDAGAGPTPRSRWPCAVRSERMHSYPTNASTPRSRGAG
ncbi:MAG: BON domain-containing protein [Dehalococcoidia bacterium]